MKTKLTLVALIFFAAMIVLATLDLAAPDTARRMQNCNTEGK